MSSSVRSVRSLTFTFPRTARADAPEASHSFGSLQKSTPPKRSRRSTDAKSVAVNCGSISRKTVPGPRALSAISAPHPIATTTVAAKAEAATTAAATAGRSTGRRSPKVAAEDCAAKSEASSNLWQRQARIASATRTADATELKDLGRGVNPARVPVCCTPKESESRFGPSTGR